MSNLASNAKHEMQLRINILFYKLKKGSAEPLFKRNYFLSIAFFTAASSSFFVQKNQS